MSADAALELRRLAGGARLTPTQRRVLAHLVAHAAELPWLSAGEVATRAGVSQPSVTRLAHTLGFDGWGGLREELRRRATATVPAGLAIDDLLRVEAAALTELASCLPPPGELAELGRALRASEPLVVAGFRAAAYLASYVAYLARKVHPGVVALTHGGPDALDQLVEARASGASAAVVVCMPRYPSETVAFIGAAADAGYRLALVTDPAMPQVPGAEPEWRIPVPVSSRLTFDTHPAALVALGLLVDAICDADPEHAEARLEALDVAATRAGTYWQG